MPCHGRAGPPVSFHRCRPCTRRHVGRHVSTRTCEHTCKHADAWAHVRSHAPAHAGTLAARASVMRKHRPRLTHTLGHRRDTHTRTDAVPRMYEPRAHAYTLIGAHGDSHPTQTRTLTSILACRDMCGHAQVCSVPTPSRHALSLSSRPTGRCGGGLLSLPETLPLRRALGGKPPPQPGP